MYGDLTRPPLRVAALRRALQADGWRVEVEPVVASTNDEVARRARNGEAPGLVLVAESQPAGRGRLDRSWVSPPRAGLTFSALVQVGGAPTWPPLLAAVAVAGALRDQAEVDAVLKWPNDVLVDGRKVCGILAELVAPGLAVVGIGLNVSLRPDELPGPGATSLSLAGAATTDRDTLLRAVLRRLRDVLADPAAARASYLTLCATVGATVRLELPDGTTTVGTVEGIDDDGRLLVGGTPYSAGDVVHLRPGD